MEQPVEVGSVENRLRIDLEENELLAILGRLENRICHEIERQPVQWPAHVDHVDPRLIALGKHDGREGKNDKNKREKPHVARLERLPRLPLFHRSVSRIRRYGNNSRHRTVWAALHQQLSSPIAES